MEAKVEQYIGKKRVVLLYECWPALLHLDVVHGHMQITDMREQHLQHLLKFRGAGNQNKMVHLLLISCSEHHLEIKTALMKLEGPNLNVQKEN